MGGTSVVSGWIVVPVLLLVVLLVWWHGRRTGRSRWDSALRIALVTWLAALAALAFFPLPLPPYEATEGMGDYRGWPYPWVSPRPLETIRGSLLQGWSFPSGRYLVGNIAAFVPLGLLAPMLWPRWRSWPRALALGLLASGLVEGAQLLLSLAMGFPWRVADVDDLLLNTLGTLIGFGIWFVASTVVQRVRVARAPS